MKKWVKLTEDIWVDWDEVIMVRITASWVFLTHSQGDLTFDLYECPGLADEIRTLMRDLTSTRG